MFKILGKTFETLKEYLDFIVEEEKLVIADKKATIKYADGFGMAPTIERAFDTHKGLIEDDATELKVSLAINTTNILDSHSDVHIKGLWNKSIKETGSRVLHLQEHKRSFDAVISRGDDLKVSAKTDTWKNLGFDLKGETEILKFDALVKQEVNPFMFDQYEKGNVTEHSVGMRYVKMATCINDDDYPVQKENWDKYAPMVANKEALEGRKLFWAVTEAKVIEGSAVLMGSNSFTPTMTTAPKADPIPTEKELQSKAYLAWLKEI